MNRGAINNNTLNKNRIIKIVAWIVFITLLTIFVASICVYYYPRKFENGFIFFLLDWLVFISLIGSIIIKPVPTLHFRSALIKIVITFILFIIPILFMIILFESMNRTN
jgi:hypothetical protein